MHIKSVTLHGFRTYKDPTTIHFSPTYNCIIGSNGSGKSNILLAIAFVVGEIGNTSNERKQLLHEGVMERVQNGSVEMILDNTERYLCMYDEDDVILRRSFSPSTDSFTIQGRSVSKTEMQQIAECAGFTRSGVSRIGNISCGFMIQQGRITQVATQNSNDRLQLITQMCGGTLFETKTKETSDLINKADEERKLVKVNLATLADRFKEMESEKKELEECRKLETTKAKLEWSMNESTLRETSDALQKERIKVEQKKKEIYENDKKATEVEEEKEKINTQIESLHVEQQMLSNLNSQTEKRLADMQENEARIRVEIETLQSQEITEDKQKILRHKTLNEHKKTLRELEKKLETELEPAFSAATTAYQQLQNEFTKLQQNHNHLQSRKCRASECSNAGERNEKIRGEIRQLESIVRSENENETKRKEQLLELQNRIDELSLQKQKIEKKKTEKNIEIKKLEAEIRTFQEPLEEIIEKLRCEQNELNKLTQQKIMVTNALQNSTERFWKSIRSQMRATLEAAAELVETEKTNFSGITGMLIKHIRVDIEYQKAVEAIGGIHFTNFVVENSKKALELIKKLKIKMENKCVISVMPLFDVSENIKIQKNENKKFRYFDKIANDLYNEGKAMPLMECIEIVAEGETAEALREYLCSFFGRAILVPSLDTKEIEPHILNEFDCVTVDGDVSLRSGFMRGGGSSSYNDELNQCNKLNAYAQLQVEEDKASDIEVIIAKKKENLKNLRKEQSTLIEKEQIKAEALAKHRIDIEDFYGSYQRIDESLSSCIGIRNSVEEQQKESNQRIINIKQQIQALRHESLSPSVSKLSETEKNQLKNSSEILKKMQKKITEKMMEMENAEKKVIITKTEIDVVLKRAVARLEREEVAGNSEANETEKWKLTNELEKIEALRQQEENEGAMCQSRLRSIENELNSVKLDKEKVERNLQETLRSIECDVRALSQLQNSVETLKLLEDDAKAMLAASTRSIQGEGDVPQNLSRIELLQRLADVKKKLREYEHVNRKAADEYATLKDDYDTLVKREAQQEESHVMVQEQLVHLRRRKQLIMRDAFNRINREFKLIFTIIVPGGNAELELKTSKTINEEEDRMAPDSDAESTSDDDNENQNNINTTNNNNNTKYINKKNNKNINTSPFELIGVDIKAAFNNSSVATTANGNKNVTSKLSMRQLSGGQKSITSLALLLSIQRVCGEGAGCGGGGVLLLDEVDAALDEAYRRNAAAALRNSAYDMGCQVILTTFSPELLDYGDVFYYIEQYNRTSKVEGIDKDAAMELIHEYAPNVYNNNNNYNNNNTNAVIPYTNNNNDTNNNQIHINNNTGDNISTPIIANQNNRLCRYNTNNANQNNNTQMIVDHPVT